MYLVSTYYYRKIKDEELIDYVDSDTFETLEEAIKVASKFEHTEITRKYFFKVNSIKLNDKNIEVLKYQIKKISSRILSIPGMPRNAKLDHYLGYNGNDFALNKMTLRITLTIKN